MYRLYLKITDNIYLDLMIHLFLHQTNTRH